jgi:hypothetical protein
MKTYIKIFSIAFINFTTTYPGVQAATEADHQQVETIFQTQHTRSHLQNIRAISQDLIKKSFLYTEFTKINKAGKTIIYNEGVGDEVGGIINGLIMLDFSSAHPLLDRWLKVMAQFSGTFISLMCQGNYGETSEPLLSAGYIETLYKTSPTYRMALQIHAILRDNLTSYLLGILKIDLAAPLHFKVNKTPFALFSTHFCQKTQYVAGMLDSVSEKFTSYMTDVFLTPTGAHLVTLLYNRDQVTQTSGFFLNLSNSKAPIVRGYNGKKMKPSESFILLEDVRGDINPKLTRLNIPFPTLPTITHLLTDIKNPEESTLNKTTQMVNLPQSSSAIVSQGPPLRRSDIDLQCLFKFIYAQLENRFGPLAPYLKEDHMSETLFVPFPLSAQEQKEAEYAEDLFQAKEAFKEIADTQQLLLTYNNALPKNEEDAEKYNRLIAKREAALSRLQAFSSQYGTESDVIIATIEGKLLSLHQANYARAVEEEQLKIRNALNKRSLPGILKETSISCQKAVKQYLRERNNDTARHDAISVVQQKFLTDIRTRHKDRRYVLQAFHHHLAENGITFHTSQNGSHIVTHTRGAKALTVVEEHRGTAPFSGKVIKKMIDIFNDALRYAAQNHT